MGCVCIWDLVLKAKIAWSEREDATIYEISWREDFFSPLLLFLAALMMIVRYYVES